MLTAFSSFTEIPSDLIIHIFLFSEAPEIAAIGTTSNVLYSITCDYYLHTVHSVASIDVDGSYHIKYISATARDKKIKNLTKMTCIDDDTKSTEYLLECRTDQHLFHWTVFHAKQHRGADLNDTKGFWKLLNKKSAIINDLNAIKSLVIHKQIAPRLLDYKSTENPFIGPISISIHGKDGQINKYDILFWNGSSPNQTHAFQIYDHQKEKKSYYMQFRSFLPNISWKWYDNDSSQFRSYDFGPRLTERVTAQIECSFQANLLYNFPLYVQKKKLFNNIKLTILKKEFVKQYGSYHQDKIFILRCAFDEEENINRLIETIEQITITSFGFPRSVKRINADKQHTNDFCQEIGHKFNLRMKPISPILS